MEILHFADGSEWEAWLETHHANADEAWLRIAKKHSPVPGISITDALDGALCFGWIDGQRRAHDADSFLQRYCPRRKTSSWSQINVEKFEELAAAGRVRAAGFAEVELAQADGRWEAAYASQRSAEVPADLAAALEAHSPAAAVFSELSKTDRYAEILRILKARSPERRAEIVRQVVERLGAD